MRLGTGAVEIKSGYGLMPLIRTCISILRFAYPATEDRTPDYNHLLQLGTKLPTLDVEHLFKASKLMAETGPVKFSKANLLTPYWLRRLYAVRATFAPCSYFLSIPYTPA
jgi:hypothetical protein